MKRIDIIAAGLKTQFGFIVPEEVFFVEFKTLADISALMGESDCYTYSHGSSHDTYDLMALYKGKEPIIFENAFRHRSGANHEPDTTTEGDDLDKFLHNNLNAECFLLHHSHSASWEDDNCNVEDLFVIIPSEREKRKFLFTLEKQYRDFVAGINKELFGHAGDDNFVSVLVPVEKKDAIFELMKEGGA